MEDITKSIEKINMGDRPKLAPQRPSMKNQTSGIRLTTPQVYKCIKCGNVDVKQQFAYCNECKSCDTCGIFINKSGACD